MGRIETRLVLAILLGFCLGKAQAGALNKPTPIHFIQEEAALDVLLERRVIHFKTAKPDSSLEHRVDRLRSLMASFFLNHARESRYSFTFGQYSELNSRMASAASCSPQWDLHTGRARSGDTATWLRESLNHTQAYRELVPVFDTLGYQVNISSLESIVLCRPAEIDWTHGPRSCQIPIPAKAKLPCGALITFSLIAK